MLRLRAVAHDAHLLDEARSAFALHRDTWYANPSAQINWWIPLHRVTEEESFTIYPAFFDRPVRNDSGDFDYDQFKAAIGWQGLGTPRAEPAPTFYPRALEPVERRDARSIAMDRGEILIFSAAHLHQTCPNRSGRTRFSVDFRVVDLADHAAGRGAPSVDDRSKGSALGDYRPTGL
jgi:hypothetical protein